MLRSILDAIPSFVLVVDEDVRIQEYNAAAGNLFGGERKEILKKRGGEVLHCLHSMEEPEGCGRAPFCKNCVIRNSVNEAFQGHSCVRRREKMELLRNGKAKEFYAWVTASPFTHECGTLVLLVIEDIGELVKLQRIVPICARCKKIRNDDQFWVQVESFISEHLDLSFSHGFCPECQKAEMENLSTFLGSLTA